MEYDATLFSAVLDTLIPPSEDGRLPGAGQLDLAGEIVEAAGEQWSLLAEGLVALDAQAQKMGADRFADLDLDARSECLKEFDAASPILLPGLIFHTYRAYYRNASVLQGLGLEARPPFPLGYSLEAGDPALLDPVRRRSAFYRETD